MMEQLKALVERRGAKIRPANIDSIRELQTRLGFVLAPEYAAFLSLFGVIVSGAAEVYGLGVPDNYYLNVGNAFEDLSSAPGYPRNAVPLLDVGDGRYYLYDNSTRKVVLWATPNGGIMEVLDTTLESFLVKQVFQSC